MAAQVLCDARYAMLVGWGRSPHGAAVAGTLRHGINDEVFETVPESAGAGESE